jgi:hypothetical protein
MGRGEAPLEITNGRKRKSPFAIGWIFLSEAMASG